MSFNFYNQLAIPILYSDDGVHLYLFTGEPVCYAENHALFSFDGNHLGWIEEGWIRDTEGNCMFYSYSATGGPVKPVTQLNPTKAAMQNLPNKAEKVYLTLKVIRTQNWSDKVAPIFLVLKCPIKLFLHLT